MYYKNLSENLKLVNEISQELSNCRIDIGKTLKYITLRFINDYKAIDQSAYKKYYSLSDEKLIKKSKELINKKKNDSNIHKSQKVFLLDIEKYNDEEYVHLMLPLKYSEHYNPIVWEIVEASLEKKEFTVFEYITFVQACLGDNYNIFEPRMLMMCFNYSVIRYVKIEKNKLYNILNDSKLAIRLRKT
ncbi:MAG: hypothetical protein NZM44_05350 [Candidatus Calescibacterium sp.]|nr:hypothetical protein [Candidatus Calescibacterium sp.]